EQGIGVPRVGGEPDDPGVAAEPCLLPAGEPPGRQDGLRAGLFLVVLPRQEAEHLRVAQGTAGGPAPPPPPPPPPLPPLPPPRPARPASPRAPPRHIRAVRSAIRRSSSPRSTRSPS